jgi:hypothetical protein
MYIRIWFSDVSVVDRIRRIWNVLGHPDPSIIKQNEYENPFSTVCDFFMTFYF